MKYIEKFNNFFKLNELVQSREDLINVPKGEIEKHIEPALMTQEEYIKTINSKNEWHDDSVYNFSIDRDNDRKISKEKKDSLKLVKQKKIGKLNIDFYLDVRDSLFGYYENPDEEDYSKKVWINYTDEEKKEKGQPLKRYEVIALHREEDIIVGGGQDEWGAVLIWVLKEYRGLNIGSEIIKIYREYYPSKDSGGFTSFGYNQAKKYHAFLVRKYLANGVYSDMVKKGELDKNRAKNIINSIKDTKKFTSKMNNPLAKYYGDTGQYSLYIDDSFVLIYDVKLLDKYKNNINDYNVEELIYSKAIKAYISVRWNDDGNFYDLYTIYSENKNHFKNCMDIALSIFKQGISNRFFITDENKYNVKELDWIEEFIKEGIYYTEEYVRYKDVEIYDILKIKNPIPDIDIMKKIVKKNFKKNDPYDILFSLLIESAESKYNDYDKENKDNYRMDKTMQNMRNTLKTEPEWFTRNHIHSGIFASNFKYYFGEEEWEQLSTLDKSKFSDIARKFYEDNVKNNKK